MIFSRHVHVIYAKNGASFHILPVMLAAPTSFIKRKQKMQTFQKENAGKFVLLALIGVTWAGIAFSLKNARSPNDDLRKVVHG